MPSVLRAAVAGIVAAVAVACSRRPTAAPPGAPAAPAGARPELALPPRDRAALLAAGRAVAADLADTAVLCAEYGAGGTRFDLPGVDLVALRAGRTARAAVPARACPPSYDRMANVVDSLGRPVDPPRPPGYVDPYVLVLVLPVAWGRSAVGGPVALVQAWLGQGTIEHLFRCEVEGGATALARCERTGSRIH